MPHRYENTASTLRPRLAGLGLLLLTPLAALAQTGAVGVGTTTPDASAILDVRSTSKGLLAPRMTQAQRNAIPNPATGLLIYQTNNTPGLYQFNGTAWVAVSGPGADNLGNHTATQNLNLADKLLVGNGGSSGLGISNAGNVGLGAGTANTRLSISPSTTEPKITLYDSGSSTAHYGLGITANQFNYHVSGTSASHVFYAGGKNGAAAGVTELLRIGGNGRVGVGLSSPSAKLHVSGDLRLQNGAAVNEFSTDGTLAGNADAAVPTEKAVKTYVDAKVGAVPGPDNLGNHTATQPIGYTTNDADKLYFTQAAGANGPKLAHGAGWTLDYYAGQNTANNGAHRFLTGSTSGWQERLRIVQGGNVGIGLTNPSARLHVAGAVKIDAGNPLELGAGVSGKQADAGKIGYQTFTADALDIVGAGTNGTNRKVKIWAEGGLTVAGLNGTGTRTVVADATGRLSTVPQVAGTSASNGLTMSGGDIRLGGSLSQPTIINQGVQSVHFQQSVAASAGTVDQAHWPNVPTAQTQHNADVAWQSFTAGSTGLLTRIDIRAAAAVKDEIQVTMRLRSGQGLSGPVLASQTFTVTDNCCPILNPTAPQVCVFSAPAGVTAGQVYTWTLESADLFNIFFTENNGYPAGIYSKGTIFNANWDAQFNTYVAPVAAQLASLLFLGGGKVGVGTDSPQATLDVNGTIRHMGISQGSDIRFKQNVRTLASALDAVQRLRGVEYDWRRAEFPRLQLPAGRQVGLIAQEVEQVFPDLVSTGPDGYKSVDYSRLTPVLIEALKEQQRQIEQLQQQNAAGQQREAATAQAVDALSARLKALENLVGVKAAR
ncbi:tail fiber domain-containing protein [Hymenobacter sp. B81]|uniref:tail fiber domain-containing protein n=1 Tax=Hymenobacter sp. B81 TaxID=3344878 RepID=UPI0037DDA1DC